MEYLPGGYTLELAEGCFPFSTDSAVLAHFTKLPKNAHVLDLGAGCGTLGLMLCAKDPLCHVTGVELDPRAQDAALENIRQNGIEGRMESICADLRAVPSLFPSGSFSCIVSNPPYFSGGPASRSFPVARREDHCTCADLMKAAGWSLKYGGDFFLVHRPERLADLVIQASANNMELKRLRLLRHREGGDISLIFLQFRKGGKPGVVWEESCLFQQDGSPTPFFRSVYHLD